MLNIIYIYINSYEGMQLGSVTLAFEHSVLYHTAE